MVGQKNEPFVEPPRSQIPEFSKMHVAGMETSDDDAIWVGSGMKQLMLRTVGRKSGNEHKVALPDWLDDGGHMIVVASFSGAPQHPAWYLNLTDTGKNGEVYVKTKERAFYAAPEILDGDDYRNVWKALTEDRPFYREYQTRTNRRIPLIRLKESRPA